MFKGKVAMITGGNKGIGKSLVEHFASQGANICFNSPEHDQNSVKLIEELVSKYKVEFLYSASDFLLEKNVEDFADESLKKFGKVDILINNAGFADSSLIVDTSNELFSKTMKINLHAPFILSKKLLPKMIKQKNGRIIFVSSSAAISPPPNMGAYSISKIGLLSLSKTIALENGKYGVTSNCILPGSVDTDMLNFFYSKLAKVYKVTPQQIKEKSISNKLQRRLVSIEEVVHLCDFLCHENSKSITGAEYTVDGGLSI